MLPHAANEALRIKRLPPDRSVAKPAEIICSSTVQPESFP